MKKLKVIIEKSKNFLKKHYFATSLMLFYTIVISICLIIFFPCNSIDFTEIYKSYNLNESNLNFNDKNYILFIKDLKQLITWQLSRQLQLAALSLTMFICYISVLTRSLQNINNYWRVCYYMIIITGLNIVFNLGIFRNLQIYTYISDIEIQLISFSSIIIKTIPPWHYFVLGLSQNKLVRVLSFITITFLWELFGFIKILFSQCGQSRIDKIDRDI